MGSEEHRCPISGRAASSGTCPMARASKGPIPTGGKVANSVDDELQLNVQAAKGHLKEHEYVKAMKAFTRALEIKPADQEANEGKVLALQCLRRPRGALRSCLIALSHCPDSKQLLEMRDTLAEEVGDDADEVMAEAASALQESQSKKLQPQGQEAQECDSEASTEAQDEEPGCPASRAKELIGDMQSRTTRSAAMEKDVAWLASEASIEYRALRKAELVSFYREFYRTTSSKTVSTSQYSVAEKNGLSISGGHRYMPRPAHVDLPSDYKQHVGVLTPLELRAKCCTFRRLLISVHGDLFDVSDRPDKYGPEGPYSSMAGHDITWALWSGYDMEEEWDKYYDLHKARPREERDRRFQGLMSWWAFYEQEYGSPVGRLDVYDKEWVLDSPPAVKDLCTVM
uniref:Cytochrome b5 heme-binding domain-containing protein n=1 Tax=Alexandrium andersonii TaxID=327968 RepID=A0A7S2MZA0_9DINO